MSYTLHTTLLNLCAVEVGQDDVWTFWTVDEEYRTRYYRTRFQDAYDFLEIIGCEERQDYVDESGPAWRKSLTVTAPREADALSLEDEHNVFTGDAWLAGGGHLPPITPSLSTACTALPRTLPRGKDRFVPRSARRGWHRIWMLSSTCWNGKGTAPSCRCRLRPTTPRAITWTPTTPTPCRKNFSGTN